jgi:predicted RNA-binding Zn-ribbon protein involved in translation (DUF1610 family)
MYKCSKCGSVNVTVVSKINKLYCNDCGNLEVIRYKSKKEKK